MTFAIQPFTAEYTEVASLLNTVNPQPTTPEQLAQAHAAFPSAGVRNRLIAVATDGSIIGYSNLNWLPAWPVGRYWLNLVISPAHRRQGVGSALLHAQENWARSAGANAIVSGFPDEATATYAFAMHHGFAVDGHQLESRLDLSAFDEASLSEVVDRVRQSGIQFIRFADEPGEVTLQELYALYKETDLDSPGYAGTDPADYPSFDDWYADLFGKDLVVPEGVIFAVDRGQYIGVTILQKHGDEGALYTEYTGVLRAYRGRQIALALKVLSIGFARQSGAPYMVTKNDVSNAAMLAVNRKLGYQKISGRIDLSKPLS